jgi:hypothetical protein
MAAKQSMGMAFFLFLLAEIRTCILCEVDQLFWFCTVL